jgi:hypothetical protein
VDLDDELRRLFHDQRLDIPVRPGADVAVVTGARRVRRRRLALASAGSTFAVAALVAGGIALSGLGGASSMPPAGPPAVTSTVTAEPKPSTSDTVGYGVLKLGMSEADAVATGFLTRGPDDALGCHTYFTQGHPQLVGAVIISPKTGVVRITLPVDAKTSMGIGVGSTVVELKARYPAATEHDRGFTVVTQGAKTWFYAFLVDGLQDADKVTMIRMQLVAPECVLT